MLSATLHYWGGGADDPYLSVVLTRSMATLSSPNLLYIIHGNGYFSQAVGDTSFALWSSYNMHVRHIAFGQCIVYIISNNHSCHFFNFL